MKSTTAALILLGTAASFTAAAPTRRGDTVSCTAKYRGELNYLDLTTLSSSDLGTRITQRGNSSEGGYSQTGLFVNDGPEPSVPFQFDECFSDGWNTNDGREFGQIKAPSTQGDYKCLTVTDDEAATLYFHDCSSSGDPLLQRQWFYANYIDTGDENNPIHVTLSLRGNPNLDTDDSGQNPGYKYSFSDEPNVFIYPSNGSDGSVRISPVPPQSSPITLNLFNVEVLS